MRTCPDPKLFGLKDLDPKLLISDPDPASYPNPDSPLITTKLQEISFKSVLIILEKFLNLISTHLCLLINQT